MLCLSFPPSLFASRHISAVFPLAVLQHRPCSPVFCSLACCLLVIALALTDVSVQYFSAPTFCISHPLQLVPRRFRVAGSWLRSAFVCLPIRLAARPLLFAPPPHHSPLSAFFELLKLCLQPFMSVLIHFFTSSFAGSLVPWPANSGPLTASFSLCRHSLFLIVGSAVLPAPP